MGNTAITEAIMIDKSMAVGKCHHRLSRVNNTMNSPTCKAYETYIAP
jgi:hypothetical protein